jgi:regulator-associated protein of mTOR
MLTTQCSLPSYVPPPSLPAQALSVGIFPYILKLLLSPDESIRPMLTFIWCKILVIDKSCQAEIVKEEGERYFADMLANRAIPVGP